MKYLLILILTTSAYADSFKIAGELHAFKKQDGLLLRGCEKDCDALKAIRKHKKIDLAAGRKGMKYHNSVGSDVCAKVYEADSLLGVAENKDRRAFCFFKDQSMVEMNSLTTYLVDRKIVIPE